MDITKARRELLLGKTIYDMNLKVADYGRVSTDKDDQLNSLENQINYFADLISGVEKWTHVNSYIDEGISGTRVEKRENFLRMIEDARLGKIDLIVTKEVSRFARNTIDSINYTELLLKYGVIVFFISDNINTIYPDSEFRLTLMASLAQDEVRKLSERVKFGIKRSIKDGKLGGGKLTGYTKEHGKLTINESEAPLIRMLFSLYSTGKYGFNKIALKLAEAGYYTQKEKIYSTSTLKKMLRNPRYKGYYTANLTEVEDYKTHKKKTKPKEEWIIYKDTTGNVPAIVSEELWDKANAIYEKKYERWNKTVLNKEFYLENRNYTSKLFCQEHNTPFIRSASGKRKNNPVWQCNEYLRYGLKGCQTPILYEKKLDKVFINILEELLVNKDELLQIVLTDYKSIIKECSEGKDFATITKKLKEQEVFTERLIDMSLRNLISEEEFIEKKKKLSTEISGLQKKLKSSALIATSDNNLLEIKKILEKKLNIKENIGEYFNLFIDKVLISKIANDRKRIKMEIIYNFDYPNELIELNLHDHKN